MNENRKFGAPLPSEKREALQERIKAGISYRGIKKELGVSFQTIANHREKLGVLVPRTIS